MKNRFLMMAVAMLLTANSLFAQTCTPLAATGQPDVTPPTENLGCVERGIAYSDVIYIENFSQFAISGGTATLNYLRIDSITNLPCNLDWASNKIDNTYGPGETGCISLFGTSNDSVGQYRVNLYITVEVVVPGLGPLVLSNEAEALVNQVESLTGTPTGINFKYYLRVINLGDVCPALDTTAGATNNIACSSGIIVNPVLGVTVAAANDTICTGQTTQLTAVATNGTPPYTFKWLASSTLSDTTIFNPIASPTVTTDYTVTVTDSLGASSFFTKTIVVDCTVGVADNALNNKITLYPNPANQMVSINIEDALLSVDLKIEVYNTAAQLVLTEKYVANTTNTKTLYLNSFSKGIYLLKVITEKGLAYKKLIVE
jgi:hypothetical protein